MHTNIMVCWIQLGLTDLIDSFFHNVAKYTTTINSTKLLKIDSLKLLKNSTTHVTQLKNMHAFDCGVC